MPFWQHYGSSSSPGCARQGKKKIFSSPFSPTSLPTFAQKDTDQGQPLAPLSTCWRDGGGAAAQWPLQPRLPPLFLPIKTGEGDETKRNRECINEREKGTERQESKEARETEKSRERTEKEEKEEEEEEEENKKQREKGRRGTAARTTATARRLRHLQVNPPPFYFAFVSSLAMQDVHSARLQAGRSWLLCTSCTVTS